jgi:hypothetical protein
MRRILFSIATAALLLPIVPITNGALAIQLGTPTGLELAVEGLNPIETVATCFYIDGWRGPGLYQCGYRERSGLGWIGEREGRDRDRDRDRFRDRDRDRDRFRDRDRDRDRDRGRDRDRR